MKKVLVELNEREVAKIKRILNENEVIVVDHIDQINYEEYIGKTVKVTGYVDLFDLGLTKLPINFTEVGGDFVCYHNQLTSLEGAPKIVGKSFHCSYNQLTSLKGAPKYVGGSFHCSDNKLTDLEGTTKEVGRNFVCLNNPLKSTKGKPESIGGELYT